MKFTFPAMEAALRDMAARHSRVHVLSDRKSGKTRALVAQAIAEWPAAAELAAPQLFFAHSIQAAHAARQLYAQMSGGADRVTFCKFSPDIDLRGAFVYVDNVEHTLARYADNDWLLADALRVRAVGTPSPWGAHMLCLRHFPRSDLSGTPHA